MQQRKAEDDQNGNQKVHIISPSARPNRSNDNVNETNELHIIYINLISWEIILRKLYHAIFFKLLNELVKIKLFIIPTYNSNDFKSDSWIRRSIHLENHGY